MKVQWYSALNAVIYMTEYSSISTRDCLICDFLSVMFSCLSSHSIYREDTAIVKVYISWLSCTVYFVEQKLGLDRLRHTHMHTHRDEQYRSLWSELETLADAYSCNSERHRQLLEYLLQATAHSPSMQVSRKTPPTAKMETSTPTTTSSASKTELAWQEMNRLD